MRMHVLSEDLDDILVQDGDLVFDAVLFAFQRLLGDAFDGHQLLSSLLLC